MKPENLDRFLGPMAGKPNLRFLEIGSFEGMTSCYLFDHFLTHPTSTLTAIDPYELYPIPGWDHLINPGAERIFRDNTHEFGNRIVLVKGKSQDVLPKLPRDHFDFIYVDGDHRRDVTYRDAVLSLPILKPEGIMIFDDYTWGYDPKAADNPLSPHDAVDRFLKENPTVKVLAINLQMVVKK